MAFASVNDLAALLAVDFDAESTARASLLLENASELIRSYTRQQLDYVAGDVVTLPGTWTARLTLPQRPVVEVTAVSLGLLGNLGAGYTWTRQGDLTLGTVPAAADTHPALSNWGGPATQVTVTYSHGFQTIPGDLAQTTLNVAARAWDNPTGLRLEEMGDYRAGFHGTGSPVALTADEQRTLNRYRRRTL